MNKMFKTILPTKVDNENLLRLGEISFKISNPLHKVSNYVSFTVSKGVTLVSPVDMLSYTKTIDASDAHNIGKSFTAVNPGYAEANRVLIPLADDEIEIKLYKKYDIEYLIDTDNVRDTTAFNFDLGAIKYCTKLVYITLSAGNKVTGDISALSGLTNLTTINIKSSQVKGNISALSGLTNLTLLDIGNTSITGDIETLANNIAKVKKAHTLTIYGNKFVTYNNSVIGNSVKKTIEFLDDGTYTVK